MHKPKSKIIRFQATQMLLAKLILMYFHKRKITIFYQFSWQKISFTDFQSFHIVYIKNDNRTKRLHNSFSLIPILCTYFTCCLHLHQWVMISLNPCHSFPLFQPCLLLTRKNKMKKCSKKLVQFLPNFQLQPAQLFTASPGSELRGEPTNIIHPSLFSSS